MKTKPKDAALSIRIPSRLKATLQRNAEADQRTLAGYVVKLLTEAVAGVRGK